MKKSIIIAVLTLAIASLFCATCCKGQNFRTTTSNSTAQAVNTAQTYVYKLSVINPNSSTIFVKLYSYTTTPSYTNTPVAVFQCPANDQIFFSSTANIVHSTKSLYVRTVNAYYDTSSVSPTLSPIIEINYR